jgi:GWxTD domain-containing protein
MHPDIRSPHRVSSRFRTALFFLCIVAFLSPSGQAQKKEKLAKSYREWLDQDVVYIITKEERDNFLRLATDEARDRFIDQFWEVRNPNPGSPTNTFRDEYYKRIAFANARFGSEANGEGWSTDRGRTYITLGEPKSKQILRSAANLRPIEIWFYSNPNPALPPFFYVLFFQREIDGPYRFYSPYMDGPEKLTTNMESINTPGAALKVIRDSAGPEVARISLSLLPDEPVDLVNGRQSLESDILLSSIKGFRNLPAYRAEIEARYAMKEHVSSRLLLSGSNLDVLTFPIKDSRGLTRLDYAIRMRRPGDLTFTKEPDGRYSYFVATQVRVFSSENKLIFTQEKQVSDTLTKDQLERIKDRPFGFLGLLPLAPGKYRISFELTDWTRKAGYETTREVVVPDKDPEGIVVPALLPFLNAEETSDPVMRDLTPFSMGGLRFTPYSSASPTIMASNPLQIAYQVWSTPKDPRALVGKKLAIDYGIGVPSVSGTAITLHDEASMEQFDATGSLVSGKKISFDDKPSGVYVVTLTVSESTSTAKTFATMRLHLMEAGEIGKPAWDVDEPNILKDAQTGVLDEQRGLSLMAEGQPEEARKWLVRALALDHQNDAARAALVAAYFARQDYPAIRSLYTDAGTTPNTDSQTLVRIATSLDRLGDRVNAFSLLQTAAGSRPDDGSLCLALADLFKESGDLQKAAEWERRAKNSLGLN